MTSAGIPFTWPSAWVKSERRGMLSHSLVMNGILGFAMLSTPVAIPVSLP